MKSNFTAKVAILLLIAKLIIFFKNSHSSPFFLNL